VAFPAWYGLIVGVGMLAQWAFFIATGQVPELVTEPIRISFHLAAEGVTAVALIVGGTGLLTGRCWARAVALLSNGMVVYTAIVSPGYFAQSGDWHLVAMFAVILALALFSIAVLLRPAETTSG